ncbi:MAG: hypothetical protein P4L31_07625 [Candidatus Babeliales bacterium]|nr:hypothetical protein [Candidatus Babeliales bacterium]
MKAERYFYLKNTLIESGYNHEIDWIANIKPVSNDFTFRDETIWVILNSGMKEQIARIISHKIWNAYNSNQDISEVFGHKGKVSAIKKILVSYPEMFIAYLNASDKLEYLQSLPYIGGITKYHLAKNLGMDIIKPDRHLVRLANLYKFKDAFELCESISKETGDKVSMIDMVLWRSANLGWI